MEKKKNQAIEEKKTLELFSKREDAKHVLFFSWPKKCIIMINVQVRVPCTFDSDAQTVTNLNVKNPFQINDACRVPWVLCR